MPNKTKSSYYTDAQQTKVDKKVKTVGGKTKVKVKQTTLNPSSGKSTVTTSKTIMRDGSVARGVSRSISRKPNAIGEEKVMKKVQKTTPSGSMKEKVKFYGKREKMKYKS